MRNTSKISSLEAKFPLLAIEQGCIVSKEADITVAFRVELPELFTVTSAEYEAMHSAWHKAIKVLPNYSIVHKQDWFITEVYSNPYIVVNAVTLLDSPYTSEMINLSSSKAIYSLKSLGLDMIIFPSSPF